MGGVYVGTIEGASRAGKSSEGYSIVADGVNESGSAVAGYILGKGDIEILANTSDVTPSDAFYNVHLLSAESATPKAGDMWLSGDTLNIVNTDNQISTINGGVPSNLSVDTLTANVAFVEFVNLFNGQNGSSLENKLNEFDTQKRDLSNLVYDNTAHNGIEKWEVVAIDKRYGDSTSMTLTWDDGENCWTGYADPLGDVVIRLTDNRYEYELVDIGGATFFTLSEGTASAEDIYYDYILTAVMYQQDRIALTSDLSDKADVSAVNAVQTWVENQGYLSSVPDTYKTYADTKTQLSTDGYASLDDLSNALSSKASKDDIMWSLEDAIYTMDEDWLVYKANPHTVNRVLVDYN